MARWTTRHSSGVAEDTNQEDDPSDPSWHRAAGRPFQRGPRHGGRRLWLGSLILGIMSLGIWKLTAPQQSVRSEVKTRLSSSLGDDTLDADQRFAESAHQPAGSPVPRTEDDPRLSEREDALLWWIEAAPLPSTEDLSRCLTHPTTEVPKVFKNNSKLTILHMGRQRPQTIVEFGEKLWIKTPPQKSAHIQAYDHLTLVACLKAPGATLHDPLLVRMWTYERWPRRAQNGAVVFDDLFQVEDSGQSKVTRGLKRLGLSEVALMSDHHLARIFLKRAAVQWMISKADRSSEPSLISLSVDGYALGLRQGGKFPNWLGDEEVLILTTSMGSPLSTERLIEWSKRDSKDASAGQTPKKEESTSKKKKRSKRKKKRRRKSKEKRKVKSNSNVDPSNPNDQLKLEYK